LDFGDLILDCDGTHASGYTPAGGFFESFCWRQLACWGSEMRVPCFRSAMRRV